MDEAKYAEAVRCRQEIAGLRDDLAAMRKFREEIDEVVIGADSISAIVRRRIDLFVESIEKRIGLVEDDFKSL